MRHFEPALPVGEAAKNARAFIAEHKAVFWDVVKPLLPYILALNLLDSLITGIYFPDPNDKGFTLGSFIANYFVMAIMITWHRVVIDGPDRYTPVNPFQPKRHELAFMFAPFLLGLGYGLATTVLVLVSAIIGKELAMIVGIIAILFGFLVFLRIGFYFPGKAVNADMTFRKSWDMSKGYSLKIMSAVIRATWRVTLVYFLYLLGIMGVATVFALLPIPAVLQYLLFFALSLPVIVYFQPLLSIIGVTVLSNYYQWAINNPKRRAL